MYEGEWEEDKRHGYGKFTWPDGKVYDGQWENDEPHGKGKSIHPDGQVYTGDWIAGKRHGHGKLVHIPNSECVPLPICTFAKAQFDEQTATTRDASRIDSPDDKDDKDDKDGKGGKDGKDDTSLVDPMMPDMKVRRCCKCHVFKSLDEFCPSAIKSRAFKCKVCLRESNSAMRKKTNDDPALRWQKILRQCVHASIDNLSIARSVSSMVSTRDTELLLLLFGQRSALSGKTRALKFVQWDTNKPWSVLNCVPMTKQEANNHSEGGVGIYDSLFVNHVNETLGSVQIDSDSKQIKHDELSCNWKDDIVSKNRKGIPFPPMYFKGKKTEKRWGEMHKAWCSGYFGGWDCETLLV